MSGPKVISSSSLPSLTFYGRRMSPRLKIPPLYRVAPTGTAFKFEAFKLSQEQPTAAQRRLKMTGDEKGAGGGDGRRRCRRSRWKGKRYAKDINSMQITQEIHRPVTSIYKADGILLVFEDAEVRLALEALTENRATRLVFHLDIKLPPP